MRIFILIFFGLAASATTATLNRSKNYSSQEVSQPLFSAAYEWSYSGNDYDLTNQVDDKEYGKEDQDNEELGIDDKEYEDDSSLQTKYGEYDEEHDEDREEDDSLQTEFETSDESKRETPLEESQTELDRQKRNPGSEVGRVKRAVSEWEEAEMDLAVGSSQQGSADLGDWYDFTVSLTLPAVSSASPLNVEIFSANPETHTSSMHICSPTIKKIENVSLDFFLFSELC